jgi:hypothetical protein
MEPKRDLIVLESPNKIAAVRKYAEEFGLRTRHCPVRRCPARAT